MSKICNILATRTRAKRRSVVEESRLPSLLARAGSNATCGIKPGTVINDIGAHEHDADIACGGDSTVKEDLLKGKTIGDMTYRVHLDGYNLMPFLKGDVAESPRHEFIYWTDDGSVAALRYNNWKMTFLRKTPRDSRSGKARLRNCAGRCRKICAWIRLSAPMTNPPATIDQMLAEPFKPFAFSPPGAAAYQLGPFGKAAKKLEE